MSSNQQFQNKVVIVTGAGSGIGADTAVLLAERGAKVVLVARHEATLQEVAARITQAGGTALVAASDVSDPAAVKQVVARTLEAFGAARRD